MPEPAPRRLLNPGPVTLSPRVRRALLSPDLCHREPAFTELMQRVRRRLVHIYPDAAEAFAAVLLTGSGTAAVEAMLGSLVPPRDPHDANASVLVVANGVYGERMATILQRQGKPYELVRSPWTEPMDLAAVEQHLQRGAIRHVAAVHHETTTGRLNDIKALGELCGRYGAALLLDAVSSFAGEWIDFAGWNLRACAATANKCLHGVPGTAFVLVDRRTLSEASSCAPSLYLDLFHQYTAQQQGHPAFTPAVQSMYAMDEALTELEDAGGWPERHRHYQTLSRIVRQGLCARGIEPLLEDAACGAILSAFHLPAGWRFEALYESLETEGFVIYPGQQWLMDRIFRVAVMGQLQAADLEAFVEAVGEVIAGAKAAGPKPVS